MALMSDAPQPTRFSYTVDGQLFETERPSITVGFLRAKLPTEKRSFGVFWEGQGNLPDRRLDDAETISLETNRAMLRFYTSPPATFG
jgi:hypothetical protein